MSNQVKQHKQWCCKVEVIQRTQGVILNWILGVCFTLFLLVAQSSHAQVTMSSVEGKRYFSELINVMEDMDVGSDIWGERFNQLIKLRNLLDIRNISLPQDLNSSFDTIKNRNDFSQLLSTISDIPVDTPAWNDVFVKLEILYEDNMSAFKPNQQLRYSKLLEEKKLSQARKAAALRAQKEAEKKAAKEAALKAQKEAEEKAAKEAEYKARKEAEKKAAKEAALKAQKEAEEKAAKEAALKAKKEVAEKAAKEAALKAKKEAAEKAAKEAALKAKKEAEEKAEKEAAYDSLVKNLFDRLNDGMLSNSFNSESAAQIRKDVKSIMSLQTYSKKTFESHIKDRSIMTRLLHYSYHRLGDKPESNLSSYAIDIYAVLLENIIPKSKRNTESYASFFRDDCFSISDFDQSFLRDIWFYTTSEQLSELIGGDVSWYDGRYNVSGTYDMSTDEIIKIQRLAEKQIESGKGFGNVEANKAWRRALLKSSYVNFARNDEDLSSDFINLYEKALVDGVVEENAIESLRNRNIYYEDLLFLKKDDDWGENPYVTLWFQTSSHDIKKTIGSVDKFTDNLNGMTHWASLDMPSLIASKQSLGDIKQFKFFTKVLSQDKLWDPKPGAHYDTWLAFYLDFYVKKIKQENDEELARIFYSTLHAVLDEKNTSIRYYALFDANKKLLPPWWKLFGWFSTRVETCANAYERCAKIDQGEECKLLQKCELDD